MSGRAVEILRFAAMGAEDLGRMALAGSLPPSVLWFALEGARKYLWAILRGDVAPVHEREWRAAQCSGCEFRVDKQYASVGAVGGSCGALDAGNAADGTCGCRVTVTVGGVTMPAGKAWIASEACGRGVWESVKRKGRKATGVAQRAASSR